MLKKYLVQFSLIDANCKNKSNVAKKLNDTDGSLNTVSDNFQTKLTNNMADMKFDKSNLYINNNDNLGLQNVLVFNDEFNEQINKKDEVEDFLEIYVDNKIIDDIYTNSAKYEILIKKKFKNKEANLDFPRTFVNVKEDNQVNKDDLQNEKSENLIGKKIFLLQTSLFADIPHTVYFGLKDEPIEEYKDLYTVLIWKSTSITPALIREIVYRSGFRILRENSTSTRWIGTWCKHLNFHNYQELNSNQKVNHFPGSFNFGRKDYLLKNLQLLALRMHDINICDFHPQTFILPVEHKLLSQAWDLNPNMKIILKPPASARGLGIQVIHKLNQIPKESIVKPQSKNHNTFVAQYYIENPLLLFNQTKFDIRLYVLVTSFDPLRVYLHKEGLVRFASEKYSNNIEDLNNQFMHLTNYSINKKSTTYKKNNDENSLDGHKWSLKTLFNYLEKTRNDVDVDELMEKMIDLILKTVISCQHSVNFCLQKNLKYKYNSFELLGFDIIIDSNLKPWLLEVNISPSLRTQSSVDFSVKSKVIKDMLNIVGYREPLNYCLDPFNFILNENEKQKQRDFAKRFVELYGDYNDLYEISEYDFNLTENLTPDDLRHLCLAEDELSRRGSFDRLFPSIKSSNYLPYFSKAHYRNYLLIEWERKYSNVRGQAVSYLQSLCKQGMNLVGKRSKL